MPQLELISWILNFLLGWTIFALVFFILSNKNIIFSNNKINNTHQNAITHNNWLWN